MLGSWIGLGGGGLLLGGDGALGGGLGGGLLLGGDGCLGGDGLFLGGEGGLGVEPGNLMYSFFQRMKPLVTSPSVVSPSPPGMSSCSD